MNASDLERVVGDVITVLDRLQVSYHVTGGLASSFYGEPRLTQDVLGMLLDNTVFDLDFVRRVAGTLDCGQLLAEIERECEGI